MRLPPLAVVLPVLIATLGCGSKDPEGQKSSHEREARQFNTDGNLLREVCEFDSALVIYHRAEALAREQDLPHRRIAALMNIGRTHDERRFPNPDMRYRPPAGYDDGPDTDSAEQYLQLALELCQEPGNRVMTSGVLTQFAAFEFRNRRYAAAEARLREAIAAAEQTGSASDQAFAWYNLGLVRAEQNLLEAALDDFETALVLFEQARNDRGMAMAQSCIDDVEALLDRQPGDE